MKEERCGSGAKKKLEEVAKKSFPGLITSSLLSTETGEIGF
jgi:hypothetical protein